MKADGGWRLSASVLDVYSPTFITAVNTAEQNAATPASNMGTDQVINHVQEGPERVQLVSDTCCQLLEVSRIDRFSLGPIGGGFQRGRDGSRGEQGSSQRY